MRNMDPKSTEENLPTPTEEDAVLPKSNSDTEHHAGDHSDSAADSEPERDCDTPLMDEGPDSNGSTPPMEEPTAPPGDCSTLEDVKCKLFDGAEAKPVSESEPENELDRSSGEEASTKTDPQSVDPITPKTVSISETTNTNNPEKLANGVVSTDGKTSTSKPKHSMSKVTSNEGRGNQEGYQIAVTYNGELYTCNECDYSNKGHHFEEHLMCHLIAKPYQCLYCKESFGTRKEIIKHLADAHKGKKLNCMLKALSRAKHLMQDAQKTNSCVFYSLIPQSQHQLKKSLSSGSTASISSLNRSSLDESSPHPPSRKSSTVSDDVEQEASKEESLSAEANDVNKDMSGSAETETQEKDSERSSEEKSSSCNEDKDDTDAISNERKSESNFDTVAETEESVDNQGHAEDVDVPPVENSDSSLGTKEVETCEETENSFAAENSDVQKNDKIDSSESKCTSNEKVETVNPDENATGDSADQEGDHAVDIENNRKDSSPVATPMEVSSVKPMTDNTTEETCIPEKTTTSDETDAQEPQTDSDALEETRVEKKPDEQSNDSNSVPGDDQSDTSVTKEKQSEEAIDVTGEEVGSESTGEDEYAKNKDSDNRSKEKESKDASGPTSAEQESSEKAVDEDEDMSIKIISSYSLDGEDFSQENKQRKVGQSTESAEKDNDKSKSVDLSGVVIDVFKDGRISVQYTKETSPVKEGKKPEEENNSVVTSKPHQTKLCQLLTGAAPFPASCTSTLSTVSAPSTSVPAISQAQMKHMRNPNFYVCGLNCNFSCLNSVDFRDHLFLGHAGEKSFPCFYCGWMSHTEESLLRHITNHAHTYSKSAPLYLCGIYRCKFGTNLLSDLLNHMQILHQDIRVYICKECSETFNDVKALVSHFEDNFIHVVNCPHCACKGTDRRMILKHIAEYHPGKAKMVSVAKQIICKDRKANNYKKVRAMYKCSGPKKTAASADTEKTSSGKSYTSLKEVLTDTQHDTVKVKIENTQGASLYGKMSTSLSGHSPNTSKDSPSSEKVIKAPKCSHCTFVARDQRRLESHMKCHGLPVIKRHRFRCLYCPQGFDSSQKFKLHINCHPGLIKYWMYYCKRCDFDSNQRYVMLRHIRTRDELHMNDGNEEDMFSVVERIMESRVLECEHCNYQTRHKLHLQLHYQREHKDVNTSIESFSGKQQIPWQSPPKQLSSSTYDSHKENASKKFKCPFCRYLVPKAADLKAHVKKHTNLGKITLDFLRCRYCSLSSTAREIVYDHIREKHRGKPLIVVRKSVTIDTSGNDNTFSETSVTEAPMIENLGSLVGKHGVDKFQCETCSFATVDRTEFAAHVQLHNKTKGGLACMSMDDESDDEDADEDGQTGVDHPQPDDDVATIKVEPDANLDHIEQVYVIPETVAGDQISTPARCCSCYYASAYRSAFVDHMTTNHPNVMLVTRNKGTAVEQSCPTGKMLFGLPTTLNNEVLLVPDRQVFTQAVKCPKCPSFATYFRRNLVLHLSKDHPEITAMGKCTWPGWQKTAGSGTQASSGDKKPILKVPKRSVSPEKQDESCIIGSGDLDEQMACLYKNFGDRQQCLICNSVKPKKFFMHIHLLRHLNIFLVGCPYCPHKGLQKYKVGRHLKTNHPEKESVVVEFNHDISKIVADFLAHQKKVVTAAAAANPSPKRSSGSLLNFKPFAKFSAEKDMSTTNKLSGPLGTPYLDEKLLCLYTCVDGKNKCSLCCVEFARKYAIHRHLVVNHLKVSLLKCGHCGFEGVEKHVIIDHILEQHKNQTIKFEPLDIDMEQKVQEFLDTYNVVKPEPINTYANSVAVSPVKTMGPQSYCLGKDKLHGKLMPLFVQKGSTFKCNLCKWKFPRRYAIHRHILMKHLKIGLYGCTHCHVQGAERYIVVAHMREAHPKVPPQARILEVDMDRRIQEVLLEAASGTGAHTSGRKPAYDEGNDDDDNDSLTGFETVTMASESTEDNKGQMVVAMFGKKRKKQTSESEATASYESSVTPKKLKTTSRMVDVTTQIKVVCVEDGNFKKFVCEKCRFTSLHRSNVYRHVLRIHEKYREQQCPLCGYKTYSKFLLDQHIEVEHEGRSASYEDTEPAETSVKIEPGLEDEYKQEPRAVSPHQPVKHYACAYCNFETHTAETIIKHTRENHALGGREPSPSSSTGDLSPSIADDDKPASHEVFVKKSHVKRGTFTENQMLFCGYCTFKAPGVQALKDHHKANHSSSKLCIISPQPWRYICRVCGLKNNAGGKMRCHINRHVEYRPYTCTSCSQAYASTDELRKHIRNLQHSDQCQYIKQDKKEQKVNRFLEESRKNALLVNVGAPPDSSTIMPVTAPKLPSTDEKLNFKEPKQTFHEPKFKGIKRTMKMPMAPSKSLKKKYWKNGLDRESKAVTKDIACHWCDTPYTVSVDQMKRHHNRDHPDREFLWLDTRQGNTCNETGEIVTAGAASAQQPSIAELHTSKQLSNHKMKYYCKACAFSAWYLPAMVSHCRCHLPKKYLCAYCHLRYSNRDYLEKHQQTFHPGYNMWLLHMVENSTVDKTVPPVDTKPAVVIKKEEPMEADEVQEPEEESAEAAEAADPSPLPAEAAAAEEAEAEAAPVEERRCSQNMMYCCNYCPYMSESLYQYRLHLVEHGTFKHLKTDISTDSPLKCGFCPYVATDQADFSTHIQTHFENRSYKCAHCSYSAYTRAHVRYHCGNQHPDLKQDVIDLTSAASYVEYLKSEKTNLPKLVDLDPRVVLRDIKFMNQYDLEELMTNELKKGLRYARYGEDGLLDESFEDEESQMQDPAAEAEEGMSVRVKTEASADQTSSDDIIAAVDNSGEVTQETFSGVKVKKEACEASDASRDEVETSASSVPDEGNHPGVVSSSVGDPEGGEGDHFDMAEVSAFADADSLGHHAGASADVPNSSDIASGDLVDTKLDTCGILNGDSSVIDEVDSNMAKKSEASVLPKPMPAAIEKEKIPENNEKVKKDETANVFDTLTSWLGLK